MRLHHLRFHNPTGLGLNLSCHLPQINIAISPLGAISFGLVSSQISVVVPFGALEPKLAFFAIFVKSGTFQSSKNNESVPMGVLHVNPKTRDIRFTTMCRTCKFSPTAPSWAFVKLLTFSCKFRLLRFEVIFVVES